MCYLGRGWKAPSGLLARVTPVVRYLGKLLANISKRECAFRPGVLLNFAAVSRRGRLVAAGVQNHLPIAVRLLAPHGHVAAAGGHRISIGVFAVAFKMPPGVAHVAGGAHDCLGG